jgi:hypothetical protein
MDKPDVPVESIVEVTFGMSIFSSTFGHAASSDRIHTTGSTVTGFCRLLKAH